jgi:serine/threonine protein kinase
VSQDYTLAYDGTKILRKNRIHTIRQAKGTFISTGVSGYVELLKNGTVLKSPRPDEESACKMEATIYELLGRHNRLVPMLGYSSEGLNLEYMENGNVRDYLKEHKDVSMEQRLQWAQEAAEGLQLLHSRGIIHCDTKPRNFLLDANLNLKIADFAGSCFKGSKSYACESSRYYLPRDWRECPTVITDLFALGSTIYQILTGTDPYEELESHDVERLYQERKFPDVLDLPCGEVITKCWLCQFGSAEEVYDSINFYR